MNNKQPSIVYTFFLTPYSIDVFRRALELDPANLKAFFFAGQCHLALGQYDEAVAKLTTAHSLAVENHRNFGDDITAAIRIAKRKRFEQLDEKRRSQEIELQVRVLTRIAAFFSRDLNSDYRIQLHA